MNNVFIDQLNRAALLTVDHAASSHGVPVLVIDGQAYGHGDVVLESNGVRLRAGECRLTAYDGTQVDFFDMGDTRTFGEHLAESDAIKSPAVALIAKWEAANPVGR